MKDRKALVIWSGLALAGLAIAGTTRAVIVPALEQHAAEAAVTPDLPERDSLRGRYDFGIDWFAEERTKQLEADSAFDAIEIHVLDARRDNFGIADWLRLRVEVTNHSRHPIGSFLATVTLRSPGRTIPWLTEEYTSPGGIPGGIEPGETARIEIIASQSGAHYADAPDDAVFTVEPQTLFVANDHQLSRFSGWEGIDLGAKLDTLRTQRDSLATLRDSIVLERWREVQARDTSDPTGHSRS